MKKAVKLVLRGESYRREALNTHGTNRFWISFNAAEQQVSSTLGQTQGITTLESSAVTRFTIVEHEPG